MKRSTANANAAWTGVLALMLLGPCVLAGAGPLPLASAHDLLHLVHVAQRSIHTIDRHANAAAGRTDADDAPRALNSLTDHNDQQHARLSDRNDLIDLPPPAPSL
ncbi:hypothetical protein [Mucisphaera calidilacus]|uniref:Uncharacterized protein n=1 Tax=Mucisphaera calidilacus TaxID=2527982 RepID=A0A518BZ95_9BACT|nr:hypothetical protein [Mucisphaera calidilacus]QDU72291.1 hypothetical protein Pan265_21550 [Mucisphaera calidilacus]